MKVQKPTKHPLGLWQQGQLDFHTYTDKTVKRRTYVLKGLHKDTDNDDMKQELTDLGYDIANINLMNNTKQTKHMVTLTGDVNLKQLQQKVIYLGSMRITWEAYVNKRRITQCRRCQAWGHATINCFSKPACLKCAEEHLTKECQKSKEIPAKCANCGNAHPANAIICTEYKRRLQMIESRKKPDPATRNPRKTQVPPNIQDRDHYPEMRNRPVTSGASSSQPSMSHNNPGISPNITSQEQMCNIPNPNLSPNYSTSHNNTLLNNSGPLADFFNLTNEIRELNKMFNISKMLAEVRNFKNQIQNCTSAGDQFQLMLQFCQRLDNA